MFFTVSLKLSLVEHLFIFFRLLSFLKVQIVIIRQIISFFQFLILFEKVINSFTWKINTIFERNKCLKYYIYALYCYDKIKTDLLKISISMHFFLNL